jgi:hypothetical protein
MMQTKLFFTCSLALALASPAFSQLFLRVDQGGQSAVVANGGGVALKSTAIGQAVSATLTISYIGASSATFVSSPQISGSGDITVSGGSAVTLSQTQSTVLTLQFTPQSTHLSQSELVWFFKEAGASYYEVLNLTIVGGVPSIIVNAIQSNGNYVPVASGGTINFPATLVNSTSDTTISLVNQGSGPGVINSITIAGDAYQLLGLAPLPFTLGAGSELKLVARFKPQSAGSQSGSLQVSLDSGPYSVSLQGTAVSSFLSYQLTQGGKTSDLVAGQSVPVNSTAVGKTTTLLIQFTNADTSPLTISTIAVSGTGFAFLDAPFLPLTLQPQQTQSITITYTPTKVSAPAGRLLIGSDSFILGAPQSVPATLPSYAFTGSTTVDQPFQQPAIGLSLSAAYPVDLQGTLTLSTVTNSYAKDPAVQFSSGGTAVAFTIPAGTLQAVFPLGTPQITFQTGTVAELIVITPSFATATGQDVTPATPTTLQIDIPRQAPTVLSASVGSTSSTGFTLVVTGFSPTRSLDHLAVQFKGARGVAIPTTAVAIDVSTSAALWFESSASQSLGGFFSVEIPFTVSVNGSASTSSLVIARYIASISVSASNDVGSSSLTQITQP